MRTLSVSASILLSIMMGVFTNFSNKPSTLTTLAKKPMGTYYSGNWYQLTGYHSYGWTVFDASGVATGSPVTINWEVVAVPNRFTISDNCGLGISNYTQWRGSADYPGPWGQFVNSDLRGGLSIIKQAGCNSYKFQVETSTSQASGSDTWQVYIN